MQNDSGEDAVTVPVAGGSPAGFASSAGGSGGSPSPLLLTAEVRTAQAARWHPTRLRAFEVDATDEDDAASAMQPLRCCRGAAACTVTKDGRVLVFGGRDVTTDEYSAELIGVDFVEQAGGGPPGGAARIAHYLRLKFEPEDEDHPPCILLGNKAAQASFHTCTICAYGTSVFLYGGFGSMQGAAEGDLPFWDQHFYELLLVTQKWRKLTTMPAGDPRRRGHTAVVHQDKMHVFGGWGAEADWWRNDVETFNMETRQWRSSPPRGALPGPAVASHTATVYQDTMIVFGGYAELSAAVGAFEIERPDSSFLGASALTPPWLASPAASGRATSQGASHSPRSGGGRTESSQQAQGAPVVAALDSNSSCLLAGSKAKPADIARGRLGEAGGRLFVSNAVWKYSFESRRWSRQRCAGDVPVGRAHHSAVVHNDLMIVVGGEGEGAVALNDVHCLDLHVWLWAAIDCSPSPLPPLTGHCCVIAQGSLVVLGGSHFNQYHRSGGATEADDTAALADALHSMKPRQTGRAPLLKQRLSTATGGQMQWCHMLSLGLLEKCFAYSRRKARNLVVADHSCKKVVKPPAAVEAVVSRLGRCVPAVRRVAASPSPPPEEGEEKEEKEEPEEGEEDKAAGKVQWSEVQKRLYDKLPERREHRQKTFEKKYLQPLVPTPEGPPKSCGALNNKFYEHAIKQKVVKHEQLLSRHLKTWKKGDRVGEGEWDRADWKKEEEAAHKRMLRRLKGEPPRIVDGAMDELNRKFYEDRKPTGEPAQRKRIQLFNKHDGLKQTREKQAVKAPPEKIAELNDRFYVQGTAKHRAKQSQLREKYLASPTYPTRNQAEWKETWTRLSPR
eukprot:TRINITY_DN60398_c0_g1_i1.p1 TRINITY_DN60398_c0_g1~~TRINITY_DN60398_c0_g1_i1.p1  ORF type:complete len:843 (+),score=218.90 TRINITY_DN60398_c0_g1_i1:97-2625(+)